MVRLSRSTVIAGLVAVVALLANGSAARAAEWKVSNFKVVAGNAGAGLVEVQFDYEFIPDAPGDIVFLSVGAGQDHHVEMAKGTGTLKGHFKGKLETKKSAESLKDTKGGKPIPVIVSACEVYDLKQAHAWIANHAAITKEVHRFELKK